MIIGPNSLLLDLAANAPGAIRVLEEAGIDYRVGRRTLAEACERAGVAVETLVQRLALALATTPRSDRLRLGTAGPWSPCWPIWPSSITRWTESSSRKLRELLEDAKQKDGETIKDALAKIGDALHALEGAAEGISPDGRAICFPHVVGTRVRPGSAPDQARRSAPHPPAPFRSRERPSAARVHPTGDPRLCGPGRCIRGGARALCAARRLGAPRSCARAPRKRPPGLAPSLAGPVDRTRRAAHHPPDPRARTFDRGWAPTLEFTVFCPAQRESAVAELEWCRHCAALRAA